MIVRCIKRALAALMLFLPLYLGTVWLWANSALPGLLKEPPVGTPLSAIKPHHIDALLKIEDPTFYTHCGLDISDGQGLTTISSILAKSVFLGEHQLDGVRGYLQSFYREVFACCKGIDLGRDVMALALDRHITKRNQLSIFIEGAYLGSWNGESIIGFARAARAYYDKELGQLTDDEFHGLIAMLIAPNHYHPFKNPQLHTQRVRRIQAVILGQCAPAGWLDLTYEHCSVDK